MSLYMFYTFEEGKIRVQAHNLKIDDAIKFNNTHHGLNNIPYNEDREHATTSHELCNECMLMALKISLS